MINDTRLQSSLFKSSEQLLSILVVSNACHPHHDDDNDDDDDGFESHLYLSFLHAPLPSNHNLATTHLRF